MYGGMSKNYCGTFHIIIALFSVFIVNVGFFYQRRPLAYLHNTAFHFGFVSSSHTSKMFFPHGFAKPDTGRFYIQRAPGTIKKYKLISATRDICSFFDNVTSSIIVHRSPSQGHCILLHLPDVCDKV